MKRCPKCGEVKKLSEFGVNSSRKDGLQVYCVLCLREYRRAHYQNNKQPYKDRAKVNKAKAREYVIALKDTLSCKICGETHPATFDFHHRNPQEKDINIAKAIANGWTINRLKEEIDKCDVLCANCHRKLHYEGA